jgi:hypothetical protein
VSNPGQARNVCLLWIAEVCRSGVAFSSTGDDGVSYGSSVCLSRSGRVALASSSYMKFERELNSVNGVGGREWRTRGACQKAD